MDRVLSEFFAIFKNGFWPFHDDYMAKFIGFGISMDSSCPNSQLDGMDLLVHTVLGKLW